MELPCGTNPQEVIQQWFGISAFRYPFPALDSSTIQWVKTRSETSFRVDVISIHDVTRQEWHYTFLLTRKEDVWCIQASSGGREEWLTEPAMLQQCPWVRLETLGWGNQFFAFGEVLEKDYHIVRVRLFDTKGWVLEDMVQNGLVFFTSPQQPALPLQLELYNETNILISRQTMTLDAMPSVTKEIE